MDDRFTRHRGTSDDGATFELCRHGGHLLSWVPAGGTDAFFLSDRARFADDQAIRGGVPVIFPQFAGRGPLPKHGFARTSCFELRTSGTRQDGVAFAELVLVDDEATRALFPHRFALTVGITARARALRVELAVANTGDTTFAFTAALHGYFAVADVRTASVEGLEDLPFEEHATERATDAAIRFDREVDRVYHGAPEVALVTPERRITMRAEGFREWVVWNPGDTLAERLPDLGGANGRRYVCVEPAVIRAPISIGPGATWRAAQGIVVGDR